MILSRHDKAAPAATPERLLQAKLPADLVKALRILALERDTTVKGLLTEILQEYLAKLRGEVQQRRDKGAEMRRSGDRWRGGLAAVGLGVLILLPGLGCGPAALLIMTVAGGAAGATGEPQRAYNTQGYDFDEQRVARVRSEGHTSQDVVNLLGNPQTKVFTDSGEEWAYRYYVPPSLLRSGIEKVLTIRFREGKVQDVRYSVSAF